MEIQNEYLPADKQDIDNITGMADDEDFYSQEFSEEDVYEFERRVPKITMLAVFVFMLSVVITAYFLFEINY
jgi:hypothetical protein